MRRAWIVSLVLLVVLAAIAAGVLYKLRQPKAAAAAGGGFEPVEAVETVVAREISWQQTADLVGTVFALRSVTVRNELAGAVAFVGFQSGDVVEAGQVLIRQDETTDKADLEAVKATVRVAEANIAQMNSQIKLAELELERFTVVQKQAIAEMDLDRARTKVDTAKADRDRWMAEVDQAKAHVAQVEARLAKRTLRAPFRARAGMRSIHEGQYLAEGVDIVVLEELTSDIYLDFAIPQQYAPRVRVGMEVMATAELLGHDPVKIKVVATDATVNNDTRNLRIRALVSNQRGSLVPGMSVEVRVPIDEAKPFVVIPSTAIRRAAYATSVFVIGADEPNGPMRAHQRFVTLGQALNDDVIVLDGLKVGDMVAAAGSFKLRDKVKVNVGPPTEPGKAGANDPKNIGVVK